MDFFWSAPPVARTLTALTFAQSALIYGGLVPFYQALFLPDYVFKLPPQLWRLLSPFLVTGPGFSFLFDLYLMYTYGSLLETGSPRFSSPGDFFTYVFFVGTVIVPNLAEAVPGNVIVNIVAIRYVSNPIILLSNTYKSIADTTKLTAGCLLNSVVFTSALILAFVYTYSQDNRGKRATFYVIQIPVEFLPCAMLALTLVLSGWQMALSDGMGVVAAHLYDFLTRIYPTFGGGRNYIRTPGFVRRFFAAYTPSTAHRGYGTAYRPGQPGRDSSSRGWTSSFQSTWSARGPGRRLGGD